MIALRITSKGILKETIKEVRSFEATFKRIKARPLDVHLKLQFNTQCNQSSNPDAGYGIYLCSLLRLQITI